MDNDEFARKMAARRHRDGGGESCTACGAFDKLLTIEDDRVVRCVECHDAHKLSLPEFSCTNPAFEGVCYQNTHRDEWCDGCKRAIDAKLAVPSSRGSGRTLLQLKEAVSAAMTGKKVLYACVNRQQEGYCMQLLRKHALIQESRRVLNGETIHFDGGGVLQFTNVERGKQTPAGHGITMVIDDHAVTERFEPRVTFGTASAKSRADHK